MEKKLIGYKLKEDCKQYISALDQISSCFSAGAQNRILSFGCMFAQDFEKAGVLDLWFEPVYEAAAQKKVVELSCDSGTFKVEVSKGKIEFEGTRIDVEDLRNVCHHWPTPVGSWEVKISSVDIGCKKGISIQSITKVISTYNELNK